MNKPFPVFALNDSALEKWDAVSAARAGVNAALEQARSEKKIGKSLEAKAVLTVPDPKQAFMGFDLDDLATLFIVSQVSLEAGENAVSILPAEGEKCERCWKHDPGVGSNTRHPTLCPRCARVMEEQNS